MKDDMLPIFEAVFLDVDDTLFDRERAQREMARIIGYEFSNILGGIDDATILEAFLESDQITVAEFYAQPVGTSNNTVRLGRSQYFLRRLGLNEDEAPKIIALYQEVYPRIEAGMTGAKSVVQRLADQVPMGVISNGLPDVQYQKLETLGLRKLFQWIILSEEVGVRKPDPLIFHTAMALCRCAPERCLYVGDSYETDVIGAKGAGLKACWFNPHREVISDRGVLPEYEIRGLEALWPIVMRAE